MAPIGVCCRSRHTPMTNQREKREQTNALRLLASSVLDRRKNHAEPKRWKWQEKESGERFWGTSPKPHMRHFWRRGRQQHRYSSPLRRAGRTPASPPTQRRSEPQRHRYRTKARKGLTGAFRGLQGAFIARYPFTLRFPRRVTASHKARGPLLERAPRGGGATFQEGASRRAGVYSETPPPLRRLEMYVLKRMVWLLA